MDNWFMNKNEIKTKTINAIMNELEPLVEETTKNMTANYWIDPTHNVFAFVNDNGDDDKWIEIHYELYDCNEELIGDLFVINTDYVDRDYLLQEVIAIVDAYYGN